MSVDAKILNKIDSNNVQIEIKTGKNANSKYYKVPNQNIDSFINAYKKNDKRTSIIANTAFVSSVFAGVILVSLATKKIKNKILRGILGTIGGVAGAALSVIGTSKYLESSNKKMLKSQNAQEINYHA